MQLIPKEYNIRYVIKSDVGSIDKSKVHCYRSSCVAIYIVLVFVILYIYRLTNFLSQYKVTCCNTYNRWMARKLYSD